MAELGNCVRITRASSKRVAASAMSDDQSTNKKRVVLGELPNIQNATGSAAQKRKATSQITKCKPKKRTKIAAAPMSKTTVVVEDNDPKLTVDDILDDPEMKGPYSSDIYAYLRKMEAEPIRRPIPNYLEKVQTDISANMRGVLVDWMVEVAEEYKLGSDTLYLSISYIDRFLSMNIINRQRLQLLGVSSMLIASKYEEITPPHVEDFCYITDNTYRRDEVVKMEADILKSLNFEMGNPTAKTFLRRFTNVAQEDFKIPNLHLEFLGHYLAELSLLDYNFVKFLPSLIAASVVFLAKFIIRPKQHPWGPNLQQYTGYRPADLRPCVLLLHDLYMARRGGSLIAVREKYKQQRFKSVAMMPSPPEIPSAYFEEA
ncbi:putative cyclin-A3-1 [Cucurbita pepo subsp. pepo]|uniref:putative cyclin-A3-1 n=1 Tax=Cucurbita pepo subsp. pepo TaxID=3664 RepID=UPI000C9D5AB1|nr:putative cyclin-A3-1 [Cucurbita pepo subsp. pepo]